MNTNIKIGNKGGHMITTIYQLNTRVQIKIIGESKPHNDIFYRYMQKYIFATRGSDEIILIRDTGLQIINVELYNICTIILRWGNVKYTLMQIYGENDTVSYEKYPEHYHIHKFDMELIYHGLTVKKKVFIIGSIHPLGDRTHISRSTNNTGGASIRNNILPSGECTSLSRAHKNDNPVNINTDTNRIDTKRIDINNSIAENKSLVEKNIQINKSVINKYSKIIEINNDINNKYDNILKIYKDLYATEKNTLDKYQHILRCTNEMIALNDKYRDNTSNNKSNASEKIQQLPRNLKEYENSMKQIYNEINLKYAHLKNIFDFPGITNASDALHGKVGSGTINNIELKLSQLEERINTGSECVRRETKINDNNKIKANKSEIGMISRNVQNKIEVIIRATVNEILNRKCDELFKDINNLMCKHIDKNNNDIITKLDNIQRNFDDNIKEKVESIQSNINDIEIKCITLKSECNNINIRLNGSVSAISEAHNNKCNDLNTKIDKLKSLMDGFIGEIQYIKENTLGKLSKVSDE